MVKEFIQLQVLKEWFGKKSFFDNRKNEISKLQLFLKGSFYLKKSFKTHLNQHCFCFLILMTSPRHTRGTDFCEEEKKMNGKQLL